MNNPTNKSSSTSPEGTSKGASPYVIQVMDPQLLKAFQGDYSLEGYACGHDVLEIGNDHYALQLWVNTMYGVELECNFGKKPNLETDSALYEFEYLDSFDMEEHLPTAYPLETFIELFEHALRTVPEN